jgi:hypothetical protein
MAKMGRKPIIIDEELVYSLMRILCTQEEIATILDCSTDTLERWAKKKKTTLAEIYKKYSEDGKCSLRRAMFTKALAGNVPLMIFLSKQKSILGFSDSQTFTDQKQDVIITFKTEEDKKPE